MSFQSTDSISFTDLPTHAEDGSLSGASLVWTSNVDGQLGTGESISAILAERPHIDLVRICEFQNTVRGSDTREIGTVDRTRIDLVGSLSCEEQSI